MPLSTRIKEAVYSACIIFIAAAALALFVRGIIWTFA
jgi:hypothetical protein